MAYYIIDLDYLKRHLGIESTDTTRDQEINDVIERQRENLMAYCNREINFDDTSDLENNPLDKWANNPLFYLCMVDLKNETKFRQGKESENAGMSFSFMDDLPKDMKRMLQRKKRMVFKTNFNDGGFFT